MSDTTNGTSPAGYPSASSTGPSSLRYRLPLINRIMPALMLPVWLPLLFGHAHVPLTVPALYITVAAAAGAFSHWAGLTLTDTHAELRGFGVQRLAWTDITGIGQTRSLGAIRIVFWTRDRQAHKARAPIGGLGMNWWKFQGKYHEIGTWWATHQNSSHPNGSDQDTTPPPPGS